MIEPSENKALGVKTNASSKSLMGPNFGSENTVDGKLNTRWASEAWASPDGSDEQWISFDLGNSERFNAIVIRWAQGFGIDYSIEISCDRMNWSEIIGEIEGVGGVELFEFDRVEARFVRILGRRGSSHISTYSIYQVEIYDVQKSQRLQSIRKNKNHEKY